MDSPSERAGCPSRSSLRPKLMVGPPTDSAEPPGAVIVSSAPSQSGASFFLSNPKNLIKALAEEWKSLDMTASSEAAGVGG